MVQVGYHWQDRDLPRATLTESAVKPGCELTQQAQRTGRESRKAKGIIARTVLR